MPITSPPRTILDVAHSLSTAATTPAHSDPFTASRLAELEQLVAQAIYRRRASEAELRDQVERNPHKPGVRALRDVLDLPGGPRRTRSPGERALLGLLRQRRISGFEVNAEVHGYEVDFFWREGRFAVEVDGWDGHSSRVAFERDRLKWAKLEAKGVRVMPVTGRQVNSDPDGVVARLLAALCGPS